MQHGADDLTIYERMKNDPEWNNSIETPLEPESTTFKSSNDDSEIEFENTVGLSKKYLKMTIGELVLVRGGVIGLKEWVGILKGLTAIARDEQLMKERKNELVEKDFIISNVKKYLDLFMSNAFDIVESQNKIISAMYQSDAETAEHKVMELRKKSLTKISREAVRSINNSVDGLKNKYDTDDI